MLLPAGCSLPRHFRELAMASDLTEWFNYARRFFETENTILLGQQGGSISGVQERSGTANKASLRNDKNQETKDKKLSDFLHTIQIIQD